MALEQVGRHSTCHRRFPILRRTGLLASGLCGRSSGFCTCVCVCVCACVYPTLLRRDFDSETAKGTHAIKQLVSTKTVVDASETYLGRDFGLTNSLGFPKGWAIDCCTWHYQLCLRGSRSNVHKYVSALQPCYQSASILRLYSAVCVGAIKSSGNQRRRLSKHFLIAVKRMWAEIWENSWAHEQIGVLKGTFLGKDCCSWDCATLRAWGRAVVEMFSCHVECLLLQSVFNHLCQCGGAFAPLEENRKLSREDGAK